MNSPYRKPIRLVVLVTVLALLAAAVTPALAAATPMIAVAPVWRPGTQLTTIVSDPRYVDAEIYVTTTVPFWTAQVTCTVAPAILGSYTYDEAGLLTPTDPGDDIPIVRWGPDWYNYTSIVSALSPTGAMTFTAAALGDEAKGSNGYASTLLLATVRYKVKSAAGTSTLVCTSSFLDRDGRSVVAPTYKAPPALTVLTGYTVSGKVSYQARTAMLGIGIQCFNNGTPAGSTTTNATGVFTLANLRSLGYYSCTFFGNITDPSPGSQLDVYLRGWTEFWLEGTSKSILPVVLRAGNVDRTTAGSETAINAADLARVTSYWNQTSPLGDANGDGKTDKVDLTLVGYNYNFEYDGGYDYTGVDAQHVLYGLPRTWDKYIDSRIWRGWTWSGSVDAQQVAGTTRDFWPTLSPDGSKIAFIRDVGTVNSPKYALFTVPAAGGTPTRLTPTTASADFFAPSWSPDGSMIAFIIAGFDWGPNRWPLGTGFLYFVDATGRNVKDPYQNTAHIFPPAWLSSTEVVYAGRANNPTCPNTLCRYDLATNTNSLYDADIVVGAGQTADMPVVNSAYLFYRFNDGAGNVTLRFADLQADGGIVAYQDIYSSPPGAGPYHVEVAYDSDPGAGTTYVPVTTDLGYYDISPISQNIMYQNFNGGNGGDQFTNVFLDWGVFGPGGIPVWSSPEYSQHWLHFASWNPYWDGDPNSDTDLHALRNTVDWVP